MEDTGAMPVDLIQSPQALVGFTGLDFDSSAHRKVWEAFTSNRGLDRHPLHFFNFPDPEELEFPVAKPKRTNYEWYAPRGILKRGWMSKHLRQIPAVIVLFADLDWNDEALDEKTRACAQQVQAVRHALQGRSTKICVVLVQSERTSMGATDTVTSFCTECEISSRSLFVLSPSNEHLINAILRLESTLHELAQNYYHLEIKNVRGHKDLLNKPAHLFLMIRHQFKIAFFNEMKNDLHSAHKAYQQAYALVLEAKCTEFNAMEIKTVAGFINYKICRLGFRLNLAREALSQFRKHMDNFKSKAYSPEMTWEHAGWQSGQAAAFASLFLEAQKNGQHAIQTQHPGIYFQLAAEYATSRRKLAEEQCSQALNYPSPDPLANKPEFFGQRPWRSGKIEAVDLQREKEGLESLQYRERTKVKHSQIILGLLEAAVQHFQAFNSPRTKIRVQVQMVDEHMADQQYDKALELAVPCAREYKVEAWPKLAANVILKALKCAFLTTNIAAYVGLCMELIGRDSVCSAAERVRIQQNFFLVLDSRPPLPEPSLTGKHERASVGHASRAWKEALDGLAGNVDIDLSEHQSSLIQSRVTFPCTVKIGNVCPFTVSFYNCATEEVTLTEITCHLKNSSPGNLVCSAGSGDVPAVLQPNTETTFSFTLTPLPEDVDKTVALQRLTFKTSLSDKFNFVRNFYEENGKPLRLVKSAAPNLEGSNQQMAVLPEVRVLCRDSKSELKLLARPPLLVGEWFNLRLELLSKEAADSSNIEVSCWLRDSSDPVIADTTTVSLFPGFPTTPTTPGGSQPITDAEVGKETIKLESLEAGGRTELSFYVRASTPGVRGLAISLRYMITPDEQAGACPTFLLNSLDLDVISPFSFQSGLLTRQLDQTKKVIADEHFLVATHLKFSAPHNLTVLASRLESRQPVSCSAAVVPVNGATLLPGACLEESFPALVRQANLIQKLDLNTVNLGRYILQWRRSDETSDSNIINETVFELGTVKVQSCPLSVTCQLPAYGVLGQPVAIAYRLFNRSHRMQEFSLNLEPSDSFTFVGAKLLKLKLFPEDSYTLRYTLYPLLTGSLNLPRMRLLPISSTVGGEVGSLDRCGQVEEVLVRNLPAVMVILPGDKSDKLKPLDMDKFKLSEPVVLDNLAFSKKVVRG